MLKLGLGSGGEPNHKHLSAEKVLILDVETDPNFAVYPTRYLCVVLHFLIFIN